MPKIKVLVVAGGSGGGANGGGGGDGRALCVPCHYLFTFNRMMPKNSKCGHNIININK